MQRLKEDHGFVLSREVGPQGQGTILALRPIDAAATAASAARLEHEFELTRKLRADWALDRKSVV